MDAISLPSAVTLTNRCGDSKSPYVRAHAQNATAWQLWDAATIELARSSNRLLFLSIGYSACHWCHVMEHESFTHPRIAKLLNTRFIPVKVDREERPDIDRQYMDFLQATSGAGGWPLNVFITPDLQPLFGGTYWPGPDSERALGAGRRRGSNSSPPDFEQILMKVGQAWSEQEARCRESANQITQQLREFAQEGFLNGVDQRNGTENKATTLPGESAEGHTNDALRKDEEDGLELDILDDAFQHYRSRFDAKHGGFGTAPKFPTPVHLRPLLRVGCYAADVRGIVGESECVAARDMALKTLQAMARGAIKDQLGNGFARYSVTRDWSLPHFEKMLYDNAQLLPVYLDAFLLTKTPLMLDMVHDVAAFITSAPMISSLGGFHSSEDADSFAQVDASSQEKRKREGAYYTWTMAEFTRVLGVDDARVCARYWGVQPDGNIDRRHDADGELTGENTLSVKLEIAELATELKLDEDAVREAINKSREKLLAHRRKHRTPPALDDKIVTSWNGLAIGGLARVSAALSASDPEASESYLEAACAAARCLRTHLIDSATGTLLRIYREGPGDTPGFADDYAFFITGLIDLYEATFDAGWLRLADTLQKKQIELFWDNARHGFYTTAAHQPDILVRAKDAMDNSEPSVNGISAANLFRLASLLHDVSYEKRARRTVACFEVEIGQHPGLMSSFLSSVVAARDGVRSLMVVMPPRRDENQSHDEPESAECQADAMKFLMSLRVARAALRAARETVRPNSTVLCVRRRGPQKHSANSSDDINDNENHDDDDTWLLRRNSLLHELDSADSSGKITPTLVQLCHGSSCQILSSESEVENLFG